MSEAGRPLNGAVIMRDIFDELDGELEEACFDVLKIGRFSQRNY